MTNTLISLVVTIKCEEDFEYFFKSILDQTIGFENLELVGVYEKSLNIDKMHFQKFGNVHLIEYHSLFENSKKIGFLNSNSEYILFIDSNCELYEDACEILSEQAKHNDLDMIISNKRFSENILIKNIDEMPEILCLNDSLILFKKSLLNLYQKYLSDTNLVCTHKYLINANNISLIPNIIKHEIKDELNLNEYLNEFIECYELNKQYSEFYLSLFETYFMNVLILCGMDNIDKVSLCLQFEDFFKDLINFNDRVYSEFYELIYQQRYFEAALLLDVWALESEEFKDNIREIVKNKEIFILFEDFDIEIGGMGIAVVNRANYLVDNGYNVTLINVAAIKNFGFIINQFHNQKILSENVKFINLFKHYSDKNTRNFHPEPSLKNNIGPYEKIISSDTTITYNYYDEQNLIKKEIYVDDYLVYRQDNEVNWYTPDGFNYLSLKSGKYCLKSCDEELVLEFKNKHEFLYYFLNEICIKEDKSFLVCDSTTHWYNINGVDSSKVYKIGALHGNPFEGTFCPSEPINKRVNHLKFLDELEVLVLLTQSLKNDLCELYDCSKLQVIPNFILDELFIYDELPKDYNVIRIFSRISPEKRISDAIRAFKIVSQKNNKVILEIYGRALADREEKEFVKLKNLVYELNLNEKVIFKGFIQDVNEEMQKSLCTLLVSEGEGLPFSLLESMTNSTPVICYDLYYGPSDIITNGFDGIIVEKGNIEELAKNILYLLNNPQKAIKMGKNAKETIKNNYSKSSVAHLWSDLFDEIYKKNEIKKYKNILKTLDAQYCSGT